MPLFNLPAGWRPGPPDEPEDEWPARAIGPLAISPSGQVRLTSPRRDWFLATLSGAHAPWDWTAADGSGRTGTGNAFALESGDSTDWAGKKVRLRPAPGGWFWFDYPRQPYPCPHTACLTVKNLADGTPYVGLAVRAQTGAPPATVASGTTDAAGKFCFTFLPDNPNGYRCEVDVPTGHGTTLTMVVFVVPGGSNACTIDVCVAVCAGRFTLTVQSADGPLTGLWPGDVGSQPDPHSGLVRLGGNPVNFAAGSVACATGGGATLAVVPAGERSGGRYDYDVGLMSACTGAGACVGGARIYYQAGGDTDSGGCRKHLVGCGSTVLNCGDGSATLDLFWVDPAVWIDGLCKNMSGCCTDGGCAGGDGNTASFRGLLKKTQYVTFHGGSGYTDCPVMPGDPIPVVYVGLDASDCPYWESACLADIGETKCWRFFGDDGQPSTSYTGKVRYYPCCIDGERVEIRTYADAPCTVPANPVCPAGQSVHWVRPVPGGGSFAAIPLDPVPNEVCSPTLVIRHCVVISE